MKKIIFVLVFLVLSKNSFAYLVDTGNFGGPSEASNSIGEIEGKFTLPGGFYHITGIESIFPGYDYKNYNVRFALYNRGPQTFFSGHGFVDAPGNLFFNTQFEIPTHELSDVEKNNGIYIKDWYGPQDLDIDLWGGTYWVGVSSEDYLPFGFGVEKPLSEYALNGTPWFNGVGVVRITGSPVPEPSSMLLLGGGLLGLFRRKNVKER